MTESYDIETSSWTRISDYKGAISVFYDDDGTGASGSVDVRILGSVDTPTDNDLSNAKRLIGINRIPMSFSPSTDYTRFYARCVSGAARIKVSTDGINVSNRKDVFLQDQYTNGVNAYFAKYLSDATLASDVDISSYVITVESGHTVVAGNVIVIDRVYQGIVISVDENTITLDTPTNVAFTTSASVEVGTKEMNIDGSETSSVFKFAPPEGVIWDMNSIMGTIRDASAMDDGKFGGITDGLTNGLVLRVKKSDTRYNNIFNFHTNGDIALHCFDATYIDSTLGPSGQYGYRFKRTFNGQTGNGVSIRLDGSLGEEMDFIVRDDLSDLTYLNISAQGHVVE